MIRLLPDKPVRTRPEILNSFDDNYLALSKLDGWSTVIEFTDKIQFISRSGKALPIGDKVKNAFTKLKEHIPQNTSIWGEWMKRRPDYNGPECIYILSPIYVGGEFFGGKDFTERRKWVEDLSDLNIIKYDDLNIKESDQMQDFQIYIPAMSHGNLPKFYETHKSISRTEGIVIYEPNGKFLGNQMKSVKNPSMMKCKYRDGDTGRTEVQ